MKKIKIKKDPNAIEDYMPTFADMVTLLMAFFVLLYAMSDPDPGKFEEIAAALHEEMSGEELEIFTEFNELTENLQEIIDEKEISDKVEIELTPKGIEIQMEGKALFAGCSADILSDMEPVISSISNVITELLDNSEYKGYMIEVEGHTDNLPPTNCPDFETNWELSAYRATGVVEQLLASGIQKEKIKAIAMADSAPLVPNMDENGNSIFENQAKNRRVEIFINKFD